MSTTDVLGKPWYKSKTVWAGLLEMLIGSLGLIATFLDAGNFTASAIVLLVVGILKIVLRYLTDEPLALK